MSPSTRTGRRRGPLQRSLLALVLVPVLGLTTVVGVVVVERSDTVRAADAAATEVRAAAALDAVRSSIAQELVPVLTLGSLENPGADLVQGLATQDLPAGIADQVRTDLDLSQARTGTAIAAATAEAPVEVPQVRVALTSARELATTDPDAAFTAYTTLLTRITADIGTHLRTARAQGLRGEAANALGDMSRVSRATALGSMEFPYFLAATTSGDPDTFASFTSTSGAFTEASEEVAALSAPAVLTGWDSATTSDAGTTLAAATGAAVAGVPTIDVATAGTLLPVLAAANLTRNDDMRAVLTASADTAVAAAQAETDAALAGLYRLLLLVGATVLVSLVGTLLVRRSIAGPLRRLADQAAAVAAGDLVDVVEDGPDEVRTVAQGLAAAVSSLRRVREQAQAVADGDLDSPVVREPLTGPLGEVVHSSVTAMIVALHERERLQADLAHQASHDTLTELPNRAQAQVLVDRALHRAGRSAQRIGLLFVDLDHFKAVNDSHGHAAGDELLRTVAARMSETVRGGDVVCRLGGDEFIVLVEPVEDSKGLVDLGRRLIAAVSEPVDLGGRAVRTGASVGVAVSTVGLLDPERLLQDADAAAHRAKAAGRGVVEVFDEQLRIELAARTDLENALRHGLENDELVLFYQPVLDLASGRTKSVEALVRWQRPGVGLVPPDSFIPVAEASSLICDLGRWALAEATAQLVRWDAEGGDRAGLSVAVNVSGRHLATQHLLDDVTDALAGSGIGPERLTIEITETVLVDEPLAFEHLTTLRALGVRVAIDDFGTGYTSIGQLSRLPVDVLKIDRSFVSSPEAGHADIVRLVITAAHSFALGVVAEGVEEHSQLDTLLAAACDSAQGFLFSRPTRAADLPAASFDRPAPGPRVTTGADVAVAAARG